ncbi:MAG: glycosyltransferase family 9 protein [Proteobacteria bacterium]|nr:glycosyltransferase family 9 protein [Pseudomonadota bacterium]
MARKFKVCIIRTSSIGDVVLSSACLSMANNLGVDIVWLGKDPALPLLQAAHPNHKFFDFKDLEPRHAFDRIITEHGRLDGVLDLQMNIRSRLFMRTASRLGIPTASVDKFHFLRMLEVAKGWVRHRNIKKQEFEPNDQSFFQYKAMLNAFEGLLIRLGMDQLNTTRAKLESYPNLNLLRESRFSSHWLNDLKFGTWLAVAPGAAHDTKRCPTEVWIEMLTQIKKQQTSNAPLGLLMLCGVSERSLTVSLTDKLNWNGPVLNLAGKLTLIESAHALSQSACLLTNDSGLLHIAEAVDTPVAAVFGPTSEEFGFPPWKKNSIVASSQIGCRPCSKHGSLPCRFNDKLCYYGIDVVRLSDFATHNVSNKLTIGSVT